MFNKILLLLFVFFNTGVLFSQDPVERDLGTFNSIHVDDNIIVRLVKSDRESASIKTQGVDAKDVITEIIDHTLNIYVSGNLFVRKEINVNLNYVTIRSIEAINGSDVSTTSLLKTDSLFVILKTGGIMYLDADIEYLNSHVIEGSLLAADGYATVQDIYVATLATVSAFDLESDIVTVKAVTGGTAKIYAEEVLDAQATSKGYISYMGDPVSITTDAKSNGIIVTAED